MKLTECAEDFSLSTVPDELPPKPEPQSDMIKRQVTFQTLVGAYDERLKDFGTRTYCDPFKALHHLDMASQECSEAWDIVEGGWKHHKKNPVPADKVELLMELVDVYHFILNAYIFMGGQPEAEMMAAAISGGLSVEVPRAPLEMFWDMGVKSMAMRHVNLLYSYADGAHGEKWEGDVATRINCLRDALHNVSGALRQQIIAMEFKVNGFQFPPGSGFVYLACAPPLFAAVQAIPGVEMRHFYAAFKHKNDINLRRQRENY